MEGDGQGPPTSNFGPVTWLRQSSSRHGGHCLLASRGNLRANVLGVTIMIVIIVTIDNSSSNNNNCNNDNNRYNSDNI